MNNKSNKFSAKVTLKGEENAKNLIKAFFEEFDEESSISLKGNDAEMEIHFRDVPLKIIDALGYCKIDELNYNSNANKNNKAVVVEVKSNDSKPETSENKRKTIKVKRRGRAKKKKAIAADIVKIPELDDIAEKSTSFEHFAQLVAEWMEMGERKADLVELISVSTSVDNVRWVDLYIALEKRNYVLKDYARNDISKTISEKIKVTLLPFLKIVRQYKDYDFKVVDTTNSAETIISDQKYETTTSNMEEIPENIEYTLPKTQVNTDLPLEERIEEVLDVMGIKNESQEKQKMFLKIAREGIKMDSKKLKSKAYRGNEILNIIFEHAKVPQGQRAITRAEFAEFINKFGVRNGINSRIQLTEFFVKLQELVMSEEELSKCY